MYLVYLVNDYVGCSVDYFDCSHLHVWSVTMRVVYMTSVWSAISSKASHCLGHIPFQSLFIVG